MSVVITLVQISLLILCSQVKYFWSGPWSPFRVLFFIVRLNLSFGLSCNTPDYFVDKILQWLRFRVSKSYYLSLFLSELTSDLPLMVRT